MREKVFEVRALMECARYCCRLEDDVLFEFVEIRFLSALAAMMGAGERTLGQVSIYLIRQQLN
jgi:hypothetical protein